MTNAAIRIAVVKFINENFIENGFTFSDLRKVCPILKDKSNQYVCSILHQAVKAGELSMGNVQLTVTYFAPAGVYPSIKTQ